jgi:hypothetical protein
MKNILFACGFAVLAATAASTGASAFSAPRAAFDGAAATTTPVTYYGHYDYDYYPRWYGKRYRYGGWYGRKHYWSGHYGYRHYGWWGRRYY